MRCKGCEAKDKEIGRLVEEHRRLSDFLMASKNSSAFATMAEVAEFEAEVDEHGDPIPPVEGAVLVSSMRSAYERVHGPPTHLFPKKEAADGGAG